MIQCAGLNNRPGKTYEQIGAEYEEDVFEVCDDNEIQAVCSAVNQARTYNERAGGWPATIYHVRSVQRGQDIEPDPPLRTKDDWPCTD